MQSLPTHPIPDGSGLFAHLRDGLDQFIAVVAEGERNISPDRRAAQRTWPRTDWTGLLVSQCRGQRFFPLMIALDAATALVRVNRWSIAELQSQMVAADALDILAAGPDLTREPAGWMALIEAEARAWTDDDGWTTATREAMVWAFRAWALDLSPRLSQPAAEPSTLERLTAWANPDIPPYLRRAIAASAI